MIDRLLKVLIYGISIITTPIFLFHSISGSLPKNLQTNLHNVEPEIFYRIMKWINERYEIVSIDDLFSKKNTKRKAAVTFDDAYLSVMEEAIPILIDLKIPSTVFLNGCNLDHLMFWRDKIRYIINNGLVSKFVKFIELTWNYKLPPTNEEFYRNTKDPTVNSKWLDSQLNVFLSKMMEKSIPDFPKYCIHEQNQIYQDPLVSYGNHTYHHYVLSSLTKEEQRTEINKNNRMIKKITTNRSKIFSIPFGGMEHINHETFEILKDENYRGVLFSNNIVNLNLKINTFNLKIGDRLMVPNSEKLFKNQVVKGSIRPILRDYNYE
jgi:peptidoglycan/xylan/chitin deacetylase (PgdA/CDA1 family)